MDTRQSPAYLRAQFIGIVIVSVIVLAVIIIGYLVWRSGSGWYESNPTYIDSRDDTLDWSFSTPEAQGMNSAKLDAGVNAIKNSSLFSVLIIRNDKLVYEKYFNGSTKNSSNNIHSVSKSILRVLVGIAVDRGFIPSLDTKVSDILPEYFVGASTAKKNITIRHLLTMSAGLGWSEDNTEYKIQHSSDWVKAVLDQNLVSTPGTKFNYSTGLTHVLSAVLQRSTGMSTCAFAQQYLLNPMNITVEHWGKDPNGVTSGGYNLYMTPREMAKFGLLMLHQGNWNGQQLVPAATVNEALQEVWTIDSTTSYGQLFWLRTISGHKMYFAWGYGGQFIYVIPDYNIVLVTSENTANGHNNKEINLDTFIGHYLIPSIYN